MLKSKKQGQSENIDLDELDECLRSLGFSPQLEDVVFLRKHFDDDQNGELSISELMDNLDVLNYHFFYGKPLMNAFMSIDSDGDGTIRYPEMLHVLMTRGDHPLPPKEARELLNEMAQKFDTNFDGKFSYAEFVKIYMSDILPFKSELNRRQMMQTDDSMDVSMNSTAANAHKFEGSSKTNWEIVRDKLDNISETGGSSSGSKRGQDNSKSRRNSNVKEGVILYSRKNRRQSWAS